MEHVEALTLVLFLGQNDPGGLSLKREAKGSRRVKTVKPSFDLSPGQTSHMVNVTLSVTIDKVILGQSTCRV